jgi:hypothetical protein
MNKHDFHARWSPAEEEDACADLRHFAPPRDASPPGQSLVEPEIAFYHFTDGRSRRKPQNAFLERWLWLSPEF